MRWFILLCLALVVVFGPAWSTNTYVDHTKTLGGNTGADTTNAWLEIETAVETAHAHGDTIFVRGSHVETQDSDIDVVSDGWADDPIVLLGDDGTVWPSTPAASMSTIIPGNYNMTWTSEFFWEVENIHWRDMTHYTGAISLGACAITFTDCVFTHTDQPAEVMIRLAAEGARCKIVNCVFDGGTVGVNDTNHSYALTNEGGFLEVWDSQFDDLYAAAYLNCGTGVYFYRCEFGAHDGPNNETVYNHGGYAYIIGCDTANETDLCNNATDYANGGLYLYGLDASKRPYFLFDMQERYLESDYDNARSGGGDYALALKATENWWSEHWPWYVMEYSVWADSAETRTYSIWAKRDANWDPAPSASQLYLEAIYWDADTLKTTKSTATLSTTNWTELSIADLTPNHAGTVHLRLAFGDYDANGIIYFDPRLTATGETYHEVTNFGMPGLAFMYMPTTKGQIIILN